MPVKDDENRLAPKDFADWCFPDLEGPIRQLLQTISLADVEKLQERLKQVIDLSFQEVAADVANNVLADLSFWPDNPGKLLVHLLDYNRQGLEFEFDLTEILSGDETTDLRGVGPDWVKYLRELADKLESDLGDKD
jgi:hypothetical protein